MNINVAELDAFCNRWFRKAQSYKIYRSQRGNTLGEYKHARSAQYSLAASFDRFTSLYIAYNRVYLEIGKVLVAQGQFLPPRKGAYAPLPDRESATVHIVNYLDELLLSKEIVENQSCRNAVDALAQLILEQHFYLHEDYRTGLPDLRRDADLANKAACYEPKAILELVYQARCNLFHGTKALEEQQQILLDSMSTIVEFVARKALAKLKHELQHL